MTAWHRATTKPELGCDIRCLVHRHHRIFYIIEADVVVIGRIIHHARNTRTKAGRALASRITEDAKQ